jgi:hypothetical protein
LDEFIEVLELGAAQIPVTHVQAQAALGCILKLREPHLGLTVRDVDDLKFVAFWRRERSSFTIPGRFLSQQIPETYACPVSASKKKRAEIEASQVHSKRIHGEFGPSKE